MPQNGLNHPPQFSVGILQIISMRGIRAVIPGCGAAAGPESIFQRLFMRSAMTKIPCTWFVVADGEHARVLAHRTDRGFEEARRLDSAAAHRRARDLGADRPGRAF